MGRSEVGIAPVAIWPSRIWTERAGEASLVEWDARNHRDAAAFAGGEQHVLCGLIEHVVDDLHRIDESRLQRAQHVFWFPTIDADPERADLSRLFQLPYGAAPAVCVRPRVVPDVELLQIERVDPKVAERRIGVPDDVLVRKHLVCGARGPTWPSAVLRRNLGCDHELDLAMSAQQIAEEPFAVSLAIRRRGIKEIAAEFDRAIERACRFGIVRSRPATHAPHAIADLRERVGQASRFAVTHECVNCRYRCRGAYGRRRGPQTRRRATPRQRS